MHDIVYKILLSIDYRAVHMRFRGMERAIIIMACDNYSKCTCCSSAEPLPLTLM